MKDSMTLAEFNRKVHVPKGVGGWRALYLKLIGEIDPESVLEVGSGDPAFLRAVSGVARRAAIDSGDRFQAAFEEAGCDFYSLDLDHDSLPDIGTFDVIVCSDVLEHLIYPRRTLDYIEQRLSPAGVLFSHVPNEFTLGQTVQIMLGRQGAMYFHRDCEEWENPHLRRFTDTGFRSLLGHYFPHSLKLTDLHYKGLSKSLARLGIEPPYCLQKGPTYASTRSEETFQELTRAKRSISAHP